MQHGIIIVTSWNLLNINKIISSNIKSERNLVLNTNNYFSLGIE